MIFRSLLVSWVFAHFGSCAVLSSEPLIDDNAQRSFWQSIEFLRDGRPDAEAVGSYVSMKAHELSIFDRTKQVVVNYRVSEVNHRNGRTYFLMEGPAQLGSFRAVMARDDNVPGILMIGAVDVDVVNSEQELTRILLGKSSKGDAIPAAGEYLKLTRIPVIPRLQGKWKVLDKRTLSVQAEEIIFGDVDISVFDELFHEETNGTGLSEPLPDAPE